jgi:hypothetical protein
VRILSGGTGHCYAPDAPAPDQPSASRAAACRRRSASLSQLSIIRPQPPSPRAGWPLTGRVASVGGRKGKGRSRAAGP